MSLRDEWKAAQGERRGGDFLRFVDAEPEPAEGWGALPILAKRNGRVLSADFAVAVFGDKIGPEVLRRKVGDPFSGDA